jgi:putative toxin-antitoxin system antitoxin component (TIGR02293 family)
MQKTAAVVRRSLGKRVVKGSGVAAKGATTSGIYSTTAKRATDIFRASDLERINLIRAGVPASYLSVIGQQMEIPQERLFATLSLPRSTVGKKIRGKQVLSADQSERVLGLERLIGQVEVMVEESGNLAGFNARRWLAEWLEQPLPALAGAKPADFMDTMEGQQLVSRLLAQSQSGAYA